MAAKIHFKDSLKKIMVPRLASLGYQLTEFPRLRGVPPFHFFRKHLFDDIYAFLLFYLHPFAIPPMPRQFIIDLWRNRGEEPTGSSVGENYYENYLNFRLTGFLAATLGMREYLDSYRWEFTTDQELEPHLQEAMDLLIRYGIPWLEDPNSKNPL